MATKIRAERGHNYQESTSDHGYELHVWVGENLIISTSAHAHDAINDAKADYNDGSITRKAYERRCWAAVGGKTNCERF